MVRTLMEGFNTALRAMTDSDAGTGRAVQWSAIHFHFEDSMTGVMRDFILPTLLEALCRGELVAFFVVRYWVGGPHLRVRIGGVCGKERELVKRLSHRTRWNNLGFWPRLKVTSYDPEVQRYGGLDTMPICEAQFMLSSLNAWMTLDRNRMETPSRLVERVLLPTAARDYMFLLSLAYTPAMAVAILRSYVKTWLTSPGRSGSDVLDAREMEEQLHIYVSNMPRDVLESLAECWRSAKGMLVRLGAPFDSADAELSEEEWLRKNGIILSLLRQRGLKLESPRGVRVMTSLIHMNNNRLGVVNRDEAFLARLCQRTLEEEIL